MIPKRDWHFPGWFCNMSDMKCDIFCFSGWMPFHIAVGPSSIILQIFTTTTWRVIIHAVMIFKPRDWHFAGRFCTSEMKCDNFCISSSTTHVYLIYEFKQLLLDKSYIRMRSSKQRDRHFAGRFRNASELKCDNFRIFLSLGLNAITTYMLLYLQ